MQKDNITDLSFDLRKLSDRIVPMSVKKERISAKDAALKAKQYYQDVTDNYGDVQLEEIELSEEGKTWLITLGLYESSEVPYLLSKGLSKTVSYKIFTIDAYSGDVISMKIRPINNDKK